MKPLSFLWPMSISVSSLSFVNERELARDRLGVEPAPVHVAELEPAEQREDLVVDLALSAFSLRSRLMSFCSEQIAGGISPTSFLFVRLIFSMGRQVRHAHAGGPRSSSG